MLMLNGYFDESGDEPDLSIKVVGMGGCVAPAENWQKFEVKWNKALKSEGIDYFHMKEFAHSTGQFATGWKGNEERRTQLYGQLWNIIEEVAPMFFGCFLPMEHYRRSLTEEQRDRLGDVYFIAYQTCMSAVIFSALFSRAPVAEVATIFDDKKGVAQYLDAFYDMFIKGRHFQDKLPRPVRRDMRKIVPLQAADIVAYECGKEYERRLHQPEKKPRWGFTRLEGIIAPSLHPDAGKLGSLGTPIVFRPTEYVDSIVESFNNEIDGEQAS